MKVTKICSNPIVYRFNEGNREIEGSLHYNDRGTRIIATTLSTVDNDNFANAARKFIRDLADKINLRK